jgi:hypothetical protein
MPCERPIAAGLNQSDKKASAGIDLSGRATKRRSWLKA